MPGFIKSKHELDVRYDAVMASWIEGPRIMVRIEDQAMAVVIDLDKSQARKLAKVILQQTGV